jgi:hypothetical protein
MHPLATFFPEGGKASDNHVIRGIMWQLGALDWWLCRTHHWQQSEHCK